MKITKKVSLGGKFAKLGEDYKDQDYMRILDAGKEVEGEFGTQVIFKVKVPSGEERITGFNQTSLNFLLEIYGDDSEGWIDKPVRVNVVKQNVGGKFKNVNYFTGPDQELVLE